MSCLLALEEAKMTEAEMKWLNGFCFTLKPVVRHVSFIGETVIGVLIPT